MNAARKYSIAWKGLSEGEHTFDFEAGDDPVSYTHLDVYKRQEIPRPVNSPDSATTRVPGFRPQNIFHSEYIPSRFIPTRTRVRYNCRLKPQAIRYLKYQTYGV